MRTFNPEDSRVHLQWRWFIAISCGITLLMGATNACAVKLSSASAGEVWLHLEAPGLEGVIPTFARGEEDFVIYERGDWRVPAEQWPRAQIFFLRIKDILVGHEIFLRGPRLSDIVRKQFSGRDLKLDGRGTAINDFDEVEYQRFTLDGCVPCIYIRQGRNTSGEALDVIGTGDPIGDLKIVGWYCAHPDTRNVDAALAGFVNGIGIKRYAKPESPSESSVLRQHRR